MVCNQFFQDTDTSERLPSPPINPGAGSAPEIEVNPVPGSVDRKVEQYLNKSTALASVKARSQSPLIIHRDNPYLDEAEGGAGERRGRSVSRTGSTTSTVRKFRDNSWDKKWEEQVREPIII